MVSMDTIVNLSKRRGFVFPSSEIYGGLRSSWDYGPIGVELKKNVKAAWWRSMVQLRDDIVGLDAAVIMSPKVWEASGHLENFNDPLIECLSCHQRFRSDDLPVNPACPNCGNRSFADERQFNTMFKIQMGPVEEAAAVAWLRPETAQGIFVNFASVLNSSRKKLPFGIAQIGKSFRNEITPGNFIYRTREFEQMEMEFFVKPGTEAEWHEYWIKQRFEWYTGLGLKDSNLRLREHEQDELSHYSSRTVDIEFRFPFTEWGELEGIANRGTYDLTKHAKGSGEDLTVFDEGSQERFTPCVIEPAAGADRATLAFLLDAYTEEESPKRTVLKFHHSLAPIKAAVLPLSRNEKLSPKAKQVADVIRPHWQIDFDDSGSIGRRYRRQDEIGTPYCVTLDFESLDDEAVTVRERDAMTQDRVPVSGLVTYLTERL